MEKYYIYGLTNPTDDSVRYVGLSKDPERRYYEHILSIKNCKNNRKCNWIKKLVEQGKKPNLIILEETTKEHVSNKEKEWIKKFDGLTNSTDGGENFEFTKEVIEYLRMINKGQNNPCYGRVWSQEEKDKLSLQRKGRILSEEWKENIGKTLGSKIMINGEVYYSIKDAKRKLKASYKTIKKRLTDPDNKNYLYL